MGWWTPNATFLSLLPLSKGKTERKVFVFLCSRCGRTQCVPVKPLHSCKTPPGAASPSAEAHIKYFLWLFPAFTSLMRKVDFSARVSKGFQTRKERKAFPCPGGFTAHWAEREKRWHERRAQNDGRFWETRLGIPYFTVFIISRKKPQPNPPNSVKRQIEHLINLKCVITLPN